MEKYFVSTIWVLVWMGLGGVTAWGQTSSLPFEANDVAVHPLEGVFDVRRLQVKGDEIYVLNGKSSEVHVFDAEYRPVCTVGTSGQGPGQYGEVFTFAVARDTVYVFDPLQRKAGAFAGCTEHIRDWSLHAMGLPFLVFDAAPHQGHVLISGSSDESRQVLRSGGSPSTLQLLNLEEGTVISEWGSYPERIRNAFRDETVLAGMVSENRFSVDEAGTVYAYFSTSPEVFIYEPNGRLLRKIDLQPEFYVAPSSSMSMAESMRDLDRWRKWRRAFTGLDNLQVRGHTLLAEYSMLDLIGDDSKRFLAVYDIESESILYSFEYDINTKMEAFLDDTTVLFSKVTEEETFLLEVPVERILGHEFGQP